LILEERGAIDEDRLEACIEELWELSYNYLVWVKSVRFKDEHISQVEVGQIMKGLDTFVGVAGRTEPFIEIIDRAIAGKTLRSYEHTAEQYLKRNYSKFLRAVLEFVKSDLAKRQKNGMKDHLCKRALENVSPRDKRTLIELVSAG